MPLAMMEVSAPIIPGLFSARMMKRQGILAACIGFVALAAGVLLFGMDRFSPLYYGDAASHLVRTRQFIDSVQPGIDNLGTVWLPLPHLLLLPFAAIDLLFRSGTAGMFLGIPLLAGTVWMLSDLVRRATGSMTAGAVSALAFGLNPNVLYLAVTPMSEPVLLAFAVASAYALFRWLEEQENTRWLATASVLTALSTLCRYEAWTLPGVLALIVLGTLWRKKGSPGRNALRSVLAILGAFAGVFLWLVWNWYLYGNPLRFMSETYGAGFEQTRQFLQGKPWHVIQLFGHGVYAVFGPVLLVLGAWGNVWGAKPLSRLLSVFLFVPVLFTLTGMLFGFVQMDQWGWNVRYVTVAAPFLAVGAGMAVAVVERRSRRWALSMAAAISLTFAIQPFAPASGVATYRDASRQFYDNTIWATDIGRQLGQVYDGGGVVLFTGYGQGQRIMLPSGLNLRQFTVILPSTDPEVSTAPWRGHKYMVVALRPTSEAMAYTGPWLENLDHLLAHYRVCRENPDYLLLQRREMSMVNLEGRVSINCQLSSDKE